MDNELLKRVPGAAAFRDWYGWFPGFHDARAAIAIGPEGSCTIALEGHQQTDRLKPDGDFETEKHFRVELRFSGVIDMSISDTLSADVILDGASFVEHEKGIWMEFGDGGDFWGFILAQNIELTFRPADGNDGARDEPR